MIRHGIMVNQWDMQGMSNKRAACAGHSRHSYMTLYVMVPLCDSNKILSLCPIVIDFH